MFIFWNPLRLPNSFFQFILNKLILKYFRVHSCQSVYFNLFEILKGTFEHFYLFYISSALKNNAIQSFFMFLCVLFMVYNFWQRTHVFTVLMYFNTYEQMRYTRGKNPPISQKSSIYILFIAHTRLPILVSTFIEFFPVHFRIGRKKNYSVTLNFIASGHQIY